MTMRLDLRTRPHNGLADGQGRHGQPSVLVRPDCFGCADCETWFQFAWQLLQHDCEARNA